MLGLSSFLADTYHPESLAMLGGKSDLISRRIRRRILLWRKFDVKVLAMGHAAGDKEGEWVVLYICEAGAGDLRGSRWGELEVCVKEAMGTSETCDAVGGSQGRPAKGVKAAQGTKGFGGGTKGSKRGQVLKPKDGQNPKSRARWLYLRGDIRLPEGATTLMELVQQYLPQDAVYEAAAGSSSSPDQPSSYIQARVPHATSSSRDSWYVDQLSSAKFGQADGQFLQLDEYFGADENEDALVSYMAAANNMDVAVARELWRQDAHARQQLMMST